MKDLFRLFVAVSIVCVSIQAADVTARLSGVILDPSGATVAGAAVAAINDATGLRSAAVTSEMGRYVLLQLPVGSYHLEVEAPGFRKYLQQGIVLAANQSARNDITMILGTVSDQITVQAEASIVDANVSELRIAIDPQRMSEIPLVGRNIIGLAAMIPGTIMTGDDVFNVSATSVQAGANNSSRVFINGSRSMYNVFQLDGVDFTGGNYEASAGRYPPPDSIQEVSVLTTGFKAEFGGGTSMFNAVSKSGTNSFHGGAWEFLRNNAMNARSFFDPSKLSQYQYNQFGASLGGPVIRNRTFFYFSYEALRGRLGNSPNRSVVPDQSQREGDFSASGITLNDPLTGSAFPGNRIPSARLNSTALQVLNAFVPQPNASDNQYLYTFPTKDEFNQYLWNVDHSFTANSRLSVRGLWTRGDYISPPALPGFLQDSKTSPTNVSISHTQVFNPTTINEARAYMQREFGSGIQVQSTTISASDLGFRNNPVPPSTAVPGIDVDNFFSLGNSGSGTTYNLSQKWGYEDNVTLVRGRHTLKFGGSFRTARYAEWGEWGTRGDFEFTGSVTGSALGDFLIGAPASYLQRNNLNMSISRYTLIGFAQDDLKVTPRLTLNLGFRWDVNANPKEKHGQIAFWMPELFYSNTRSTLYPNMPPGQLYTGDPGVPDRVGSNHYGDWGTVGPRVGFAYDLTGDGKTVLRASFGIFSVPVDLQQVNNASERPPFQIVATVNYPKSFQEPFQGRVDPFINFNQGKDFDFSSLLPINPAPDAVDYRNGYSQQWSVTLERQIAKDVKASVSYLGSHALALLQCPGIAPARYIPGVDATGQPLSTLDNIDSRRPFAPYWQDVYYCKTDATRKYDSLQFMAEKRFSRGWTLSGNYSLANAMSWSDDGTRQRTQDENNAYAEYARTNTSVRHSAAITWVYNAPNFTENRLGGVFVNGWEFSGITTLRSGFPFSLRTGTDNSLTGTDHDRPDQILPDGTLPSDRSRSSRIAEYFNTGAFLPNRIGHFGNVGYNSLTGPGSFNIDAGLMKRFAISEHMGLQFRSEAFNLLNRPTFGNPDRFLNSNTFGQLVSAGPGRILQLGLKLTF